MKRIALLVVASLSGFAQTKELSSEFEVTSVKPSSPGGQHGVWTDGSHNRIRMLGMNLKQLMSFAYDVESYRVAVQLPMAPEQYDVVAKIPEDIASLPEAERWRHTHLLTQRLLATRFQLTFHHETREMEVYRLGIAKTGAKIKELGPNPGDIVFTDRHAGHLSAQQMPMSQLADILRGELKRPVLDVTGIQGVFDVKLDWAPDDGADPKPGLLYAVEEQLGLKLQAGKSPIDVLVADHAEHPSEN